jgi:hypothetical protein
MQCDPARQAGLANPYGLGAPVTKLETLSDRLY